MRLCRSTVEHPFAALKYRIFGHPMPLTRVGSRSAGGDESSHDGFTTSNACGTSLAEVGCKQPWRDNSLM